MSIAKSELMKTSEITTSNFKEQLIQANIEIERLKNLLSSSNDRVLQYANIASHDLQEPLRKIQIFASILRERATISSADNEIVEKIYAASNRMSLLINDVVLHSNVSNSEKMKRPVDLNSVVNQVLTDFELVLIQKNVSISLDPLPVIPALAIEMNHLFYNLIDNALKFSDVNRTLEIAIRCKELTAKTVSEFMDNPTAGKVYYDISIRDNGIGFNNKYAEQIFKVFSKLHSKEKYSGSGMGLSLCRDIVANHEGVLFVESNPGEGSAFHVIIPK